METPERVRVRDLLLQTEARLAAFRAELGHTHENASLTATPSKASSVEGIPPAAAGHAQLARALFHGAPTNMDDAPQRAPDPRHRAKGHDCHEEVMPLSKINTSRFPTEEEDFEVDAPPYTVEPVLHVPLPI